MFDLACSRDGRTVCSAGRDGRVRVWDVATGELRWEFERAARDLVVSPDGARAWVITAQGDVWPLGLERGDEHERVWAPRGRVRAGLHTERSALSPDGRWLLPSCDEGPGGVSVVDLARGASVVLTAPGAGELLPLGAFTADARGVVLLGGVRTGRTGRAAPALYRFSLPDGAPKEIRTLRFSRGAATAQVQVRRMPCAFGGSWVLFSSATGLLARLRIDDDQPATWVKASVGTWGAPVSDERHALVMAARRTAVVTIAHDTASVAGVASVGETLTALALMADGAGALAGTASGRVLPMRLRDVPR